MSFGFGFNFKRIIIRGIKRKWRSWGCNKFIGSATGRIADEFMGLFVIAKKNT